MGGPPIDRVGGAAVSIVDVLGTALPGGKFSFPATFATVTLSGFAPGPTVSKYLAQLAPQVTCKVEAVHPLALTPAMLSNAGRTFGELPRAFSPHTTHPLPRRG